jgi:hypothetical protein
LGCSKPAVLRELCGRLRERGLRVGGFVQPDARDRDGELAGWDLENLASGARSALARRSVDPVLCDYAFDSEAFARARRWLEASGDDIFIVHAVGKLEAAGRGHWPALEAALANPAAPRGRETRLDRDQERNTESTRSAQLLDESASCTTIRSTMTKRAGVTRKVSVSVHQDDLKLIKERARRAHGGNVSAVFAELVARIRREEALRKAFDWYGEPIALGDDDRACIDREIFGAPSAARRRKKAS